MASNYSFFCLLFSNRAQPRKSCLPLLECFDSGTANSLDSWTNTTVKVPKVPLVLSYPPHTPKGMGVMGRYPAPSASSPHILAWPETETFPSFPPRVPFSPVSPKTLCLSWGRKPPAWSCVMKRFIKPNQWPHYWLILGARGGSRRKGPSLVSSLSTNSRSTGIS